MADQVDQSSKTHTQKMSELHEQIKTTFYDVMKQSLEQMIETQNFTNENIDWLVRLCTEIKDRLNRLTPRRIDLHAQLSKSMDTELIEQMLKHAAFEHCDLEHLVCCIFDRIDILCAASQDKKAKALKAKILTEGNFGKAVSLLIMETNVLIDEIEELAAHSTKKHVNLR